VDVKTLHGTSGVSSSFNIGTRHTSELFTMAIKYPIFGYATVALAKAGI
jgi:hypothetical protein